MHLGISIEARIFVFYPDFCISYLPGITVRVLIP